MTPRRWGLVLWVIFLALLIGSAAIVGRGCRVPDYLPEFIKHKLNPTGGKLVPHNNRLDPCRSE